MSESDREVARYEYLRGRAEGREEGGAVGREAGHRNGRAEGYAACQADVGAGLRKQAARWRSADVGDERGAQILEAEAGRIEAGEHIGAAAKEGK
jgi:hypothetical protein